MTGDVSRNPIFPVLKHSISWEAQLIFWDGRASTKSCLTSSFKIIADDFTRKKESVSSLSGRKYSHDELLEFFSALKAIYDIKDPIRALEN
jgi:hypothetical protein